jgi:(E)-4-hydroxy-3-methylbut-2-enyl-diphosphate synthase
MILSYNESITSYKRLTTKEVNVGGLLLGGLNPIRIQTMTTTDTMDTIATVEQSIRCIEAGAELIRITAPSKTEAENLLHIKNELRKRGYNTPIVADIHFTPNAAEIAARIIEKVRVNPGNYVDKKKFEFIEYTDADYQEEIDRIRERFTPLVRICKEHGTAMRIGTNHGSLSDRIMSRFGDSPIGMVESALEFLRIARYESYHNIVLSMKSSNPQVMVQAYRLLIQKMNEEFGEIYPLHLGVTEAGDGEDGRIKSAIGIGTLLEDGIGDTIRVSLTEDPEFEIPVCKDLVARYTNRNHNHETAIPEMIQATQLPYSPFEYAKTKTNALHNIGGTHVPVVIADCSHMEAITPTSLEAIGYSYNKTTDKWTIADAAADYIFAGDKQINFALPGTLQVIMNSYSYGLTDFTHNVNGRTKYFPLFEAVEYVNAPFKNDHLNFVMLDCFSDNHTIEAATNIINIARQDATMVICLSSMRSNSMQAVRYMCCYLKLQGITNPIVIIADSKGQTIDEHLIALATDTGALFLDGFGDGICLGLQNWQLENSIVAGRTYLENKSIEQFLNNTAFSILQATRTRISKTEYISCPSCGRTLFDLQETTAKIRQVTNHLKGVKIAIMGCIVNGPGEMADADFGYVGSGVGKITLYKNKDVVKKNIPTETAVDELINLLKEHGAWVEP